MQAWRMVVTFLTTMLLQLTLVPLLPLIIRPDLVAVVVVGLALLKGSEPAARSGFILGITLDLISGKLIGLNTLVLTLLGLLVGLGEGRLYKDIWLVPLLGIFTATLLKGVLIMLLASLAGMSLLEGSGYVFTVLAESVSNTLFGLPVYYYLTKYIHPRQVETNGWKNF